MLYLVGAGLVPKHISKEAVEAVRKCEKVILDGYTVPMAGEMVGELEEILGRKVEVADREDLEEGAPKLIEEAKRGDLAVITFGDPMAATTHVVLTLIADKKGVEWKYIPGVSILTYIPSRLGLEHYKFGWTVTVPKQWRYAPSFYDRIRENLKRKMHTLILLEAMDVREGTEAIIYWAERLGRGWEKIIGVGRAGMQDEKIVFGNPEDLLEETWPEPPHSIVIPGSLHPVEEEALRRFVRGER